MSGGIPLGPYRLMRRLGTGGMAEIFLARRDGVDGFSRELVVKRVLPNLAIAPEFRKMFQTEARLAALLSHPNIVHVYDFGSVAETDGEQTFYLAMELVRGVDLRALVIRAAEDMRMAGRKHAIPPQHAAKIASFVCEGLAYAHDLTLDGAPANIVHRDVTPSNVLLSFDGAVKLADFGIAKSQVSDDKTAHGVVKGKQNYLSPEQARGEPLDRRSDLFNVGILLFESILGQPLFSQSDRVLARGMATRGEIPDRMRIRRLPGVLADVVERALSARAVDRYPDALALRDDLEGFVRKSGEPSGSVEIGRLVRGLFPQTIAEDARGVRAAGTIAVADLPRSARGVEPATKAIVMPGIQTSVDDEDEGARGLVSSGTFWMQGDGSAPTALAVAVPNDDEAATTTYRAKAGLDDAATVIGDATIVEPARSRLDPRIAVGLAAVLVLVVVIAVGVWRSGTTTAHLHITTQPPSALVRIDGEVRGTSPIELDLAPRATPHHVEITLPSYEPLTDDLVLDEAGSDARLSFALRPATP